MVIIGEIRNEDRVLKSGKVADGSWEVHRP